MDLTAKLCDGRDLETAQFFYVWLLQAHIGAPLPVPEGVMRAGEEAAGWPRMQAWLRILDMATSASMLRAALEKQPAAATAESLLRYLISAEIATDETRDKIDFLITWLCRRTPVVEGAATATAPAQYGSDASSVYLGRALEALRMIEVPPLGEAESKLLKQFDTLEAELSSCQQLSEMVAFGIRNKIRELKHALGQAITHPAALASVAAFNIAFGRHFERLFLQGARRLSSDSTDLESLAALIRNVGFLVADIGSGAPAAAARQAPPQPAAAPAGAVTPQEQHGSSAVVAKSEESKINDMTVTISNQLAAMTGVEEITIELSDARLPLSPAEADAFRTPYKEEKSFRATSAATFISLVSMHARMLVVFENFKTRQHSAHLWQQDAESLASLLTLGARALERSDAVVATARGRGLVEKHAALNATRDRLLALCREVGAALSARKGQLSAREEVKAR